MLDFGLVEAHRIVDSAILKIGDVAESFVAFAFWLFGCGIPIGKINLEVKPFFVLGLSKVLKLDITH